MTKQYFTASLIVLCSATILGAPPETQTLPAKEASAPKAVPTQVAAPAGSTSVRLEDVNQPSAGAQAVPNKSMSSQLRQEREQLEIQTEEEMTQELEKARIQDEKARREQFFAKDVFNSSPQPEPQPQLEMEAAPASAMTAMQGQTEMAYTPEMDENTGYNYYLSLSGGMLNYPAVANIASANGAAGIALGVSLTEHFWLEAGMTYSFQEAQTQSFIGSAVEDIDHIGVSAIGSYKFNMSAMPWLIPSIGVALAYTNRQYDGGDNSSSSFDAGAVVAADIPVGTGVTLGLEYRFMANLSYEREIPSSNFNTLQGFSTNQVEDLETFNYQMVLLNAKILF